MRTLFTVLFFISACFAYMPKDELLLLLKGPWQYVGYSYFAFGTPDSVSYNSKIEFTDTIGGDSIHYLQYFNDSLVGSAKAPLYLRKTMLHNDTQWAIAKVLTATSDTTFIPIWIGSSPSIIASISDIEIVLNPDVTDAGSFVFSRSVIATEKYRNEKDLPLLLYPNPLQQPSNIRIDCEKPVLSIRIFNIQGAQVSFINAPKNRFMLDIGNLSPGIYLVKAKTARHIYSKKLVILE